MATKRPAKPRRTRLQEASDPTTDPERLYQLARSNRNAVAWAAMRNPSLSEEAWRKFLLIGYPETWANPMAPFYVLTWTPREEDRGTTLDDLARLTMCSLWSDPDRCSPEGKALIVANIHAWWDTCESGDDMMIFLGRWAQVKGKDSPEFRETLRILVLCVRTMSHLTDQDRETLDLLEAWAAGGQDRRDEAYELASSKVVTYACRFAHRLFPSPSDTLEALRETVASDKEGQERKEAIAEHQRLLADLIRQAMPLPPVVD
jgi:hypothetical protein